VTKAHGFPASNAVVFAQRREFPIIARVGHHRNYRVKTAAVCAVMHRTGGEQAAVALFTSDGSSWLCYVYRF